MGNTIQIILEATDKASATFKKFGTDLDEIGKKLTKIGAGMTAALTLPILAMGNASIDAAATLADNMGKVDGIFQTSAGEIEAWADTAATAFGLSKGQALEAANKLGTMFVGLGAGSDAAADMSQGIVTLASDLATFGDMDPSAALDMLQSGLVGRGLQLKKFGIDIDAAKVQAKALEMGLAATSAELTEGDLVMARYALITQQATLFQGDFNKSIGEADGKAMLLNAQFMTMKETIGTQLLPIKLQLMTVVSNLLTAFNNLSPGMQIAIITFVGILAAAGPVLMIVGQLITVVGALGPVFTAIGTAIGAVGPILAGIGAVITGPVLIAIAALAAGILLLYLGWKNNWLGIQDSFTLVIDNIKAIWQAFLLILKGDWAGAGEVLKTSFSKTWEEIKNRFEAVKTTLGNIAKAVGNFIVSGLVDGVKSAAGKLIEAVKGVVNSALDAAKALLGISSPSSVFSQIGQQMMAGMAQGIRGGVTQPVGALAYATPQLMGAAGGVNISMNNNISSGIDIEVMAQRVAQIIQRRRR